MDETISSGRLQKLLGINSAALSELAREGVVQRAERRGYYVLETSVRGYIGRLQAAARGKGGEDAQEARARFAAAQTALTEAKARQLSGELVEASEVEVFWKGKLRAFRNRVLSVPARVRDLNARQNVVLTQELCACLNELADDKAG
jgi:phage terminase Nu1 subunit (DNA packaging protein)